MLDYTGWNKTQIHTVCTQSIHLADKVTEAHFYLYVVRAADVKREGVEHLTLSVKIRKFLNS